MIPSSGHSQVPDRVALHVAPGPEWGLYATVSLHEPVCARVTAPDVCPTARHVWEPVGYISPCEPCAYVCVPTRGPVWKPVHVCKCAHLYGLRLGVYSVLEGREAAQPLALRQPSPHPAAVHPDLLAPAAPVCEGEAAEEGGGPRCADGGHRGRRG